MHRVARHRPELDHIKLCSQCVHQHARAAIGVSAWVPCGMYPLLKTLAEARAICGGRKHRLRT